MHSSQSESALSSAKDLEAQARADLASGRWRKARDAFKELCKRDRRAFEPLLTEANVGLARAMLANGLVAEARQVLSYLKTFAPHEIVATLESEMARPVGSSSKDVPDPVALLAGNSLSPGDRLRWADQLVVAFDGGALNARTPTQAQIVDDLRAIHQAIEAACAGDHDAGLDLVRPLKRDSAFAHWRLFVRGAVAFQRCDDEKAAQYFEGLPRDSAAGRASAAWLLAMGRRGGAADETQSETIVEAAAALSGNPGWGRPLTRAEALWRAGKHGSSYRSVRDARKTFPSDGIDLSAALSEFYFNSIFALHADERAAYEDDLYGIEINSRAKNATERKLVRRTLALLMASGAGGDVEPDELRQMWEAFLHEHERAHGANPRLISAGWAWLGEMLALARAPSPFEDRAPKPVNGAAAIAALERSIALDPANSRAHVVLCSLLGAMKRVREQHRLLDVMAERFPKDKEVLLAAGAGCLDRKALVKAVDYYERALALDRLDPATPDHLATAYLALARQHYGKKRPTDARAVLDLADGHTVDAPENLVRSRWCLAARRGALELVFGHAAHADTALAKARAAAPSPVAFLFFARLAWSFYGGRGVFPASLQAELNHAVAHQATVREAARLVEVMLYWTRGNRSLPSSEETWLRRYLKAAARSPFTRADAALLLERLRTLPAFEGEARGVVTRVLKRDGSDPLFRLYKHLLQPFPTLDQSKYEAILAEARRRGDAAAETLAREVVGERAMFPPASADAWYDPSEDPDEFDDERDGARGLPPIGGPDEQAAMAAIMELFAHAPPSEIARIRKHGALGIPLELFDLVVSLAQAGIPLPAMTNPRKRRRGRRRSKAAPSAAPVVVKAPEPRAESNRPPATNPPRNVPSPDPRQTDLF